MRQEHPGRRGGVPHQLGEHEVHGELRRAEDGEHAERAAGPLREGSARPADQRGEQEGERGVGQATVGEGVRGDPEPGGAEGEQRATNGA